MSYAQIWVKIACVNLLLLTILDRERRDERAAGRNGNCRKNINNIE